MASLAVVQGESHAEMADGAGFSSEHVLHRQTPGGLFLDVEELRMAIVAVKPLFVRLVGKDG